jgi:hypothetical protein
MTKSKSMFEKTNDVFENWDKEAFKNLFHEDYMKVRETEMVNRDEHVEDVSKLASQSDWNWHTDWNWHKIVKNMYEDEYVSVSRWEENGEIVTNCVILREGQFWRSMVNSQMLHLINSNCAVERLFQNQEEVA